MGKSDKTRRSNRSVEAEFYNDSLQSPFAKGGFHYCALGEYTEGHRKGEKAVCKWFIKQGHVVENTFFSDDIRAMEKGVELVALWNSERIIEQPIRVNVPEVWTFPKSDFFANDTKVLVEPFIENYRKFNSNTGWQDSSTPWPQVMQALSQFTYHVSKRRYVLCDLQGGVYSKAVVLTDTAILSHTGEFGATDFGPKGISSFFSQHCCNKYCRPHWRKPNDRTQYLEARKGTSMSLPREKAYSAMPPPPKRIFLGHRHN